MAHSHSFNTYTNWSVIPPLIAGGITFFYLSVLVMIATIFRCSPGALLKCNPNLDSPFRLVKVTFGKYIKKMESSQKFTFYCYEIAPWQIIMLSTVTVVILGPTFMSFWVSFLVDETLVCDPKLNCFLRDSSTHIFSSSKRLDNCTSSYNGTNGTVVCFQFVFDFTGGFSSAVGFMGVAVVYCRMYIYAMIWFRECCGCQTMGACTMAVSIMMHTVALALAGWIFRVISTVSDVVFQTNKSTIIFYAYFISFVYVGPLAGFYVTFVLRGAKKITKPNNEEKDRHSINQSNYTILPQD